MIKLKIYSGWFLINGALFIILYSVFMNYDVFFLEKTASLAEGFVKPIRFILWSTLGQILVNLGAVLFYYLHSKDKERTSITINIATLCTIFLILFLILYGEGFYAFCLQ
jgi:hypothetical protein